MAAAATSSGSYALHVSLLSAITILFLRLFGDDRPVLADCGKIMTIVAAYVTASRVVVWTGQGNGVAERPSDDDDR